MPRRSLVNKSFRFPKYSNREHSQFEKDGYVRLGRLLSSNDLSNLRSRIDDLMLGNRIIDGITFQLDDNSNHESLSRRTSGTSEHTLAYRRVDELHLDPFFLRYMQHPLFRDITRRYIGENVSIFRSMFMNKPANGGTELPWHQDIGAGWGIDSDPTTTVWTALDDASVATGCMQIVPGSHKLGILNQDHYTSKEDQTAYCSQDQIIDLVVPAGEAVLIHNWVLHRSGVNKTDNPRRAFSIAYMDAATRSVKSGQTFPFIFGKQTFPSPGK